jgi:hypothetical protein
MKIMTIFAQNPAKTLTAILKHLRPLISTKNILTAIALTIGLGFMACSEEPPYYPGGSISFANSVFVAGEDVYVTGLNCYDDQYRIPTYDEFVLWKNGIICYRSEKMKPIELGNLHIEDIVKSVLEDDGHTNYSGLVTHSLFFSDGDVYIPGSRLSDDPPFSQVLALWKNGVDQYSHLNTLGSPTSVFVAGSDVYMAGIEEFPSETSSYPSNRTKPSLWKNGVKQFLDVSNNTRYGQAKSVFVSDGNVYVAGWDDNSVAALWKNGVKQTLFAGYVPAYSYAYSVFVCGGDVYVVGEANGYAVIWKNGMMRRLNGHSDSCARSVFVSDGEVYVAGSCEYNATLWKNGVAQKLPSVN